MKTILFMLAVVLSIQAVFATENGKDETDKNTPTKCESPVASGTSKEVLAQSGCCSHHGGVCGCSSGRVTCCDGANSPSCGCNKEEPVRITN